MGRGKGRERGERTDGGGLRKKYSGAERGKEGMYGGGRERAMGEVRAHPYFCSPVNHMQ